MDPRKHDLRLRTGELVERALAGDKDAVAALYGLYEKRLVTIAHRRLGHTLHGLMESVDLVQSVWKDVLGDLDGFEDRGPDSFFRWLHTCLLHKIVAKKRYHIAEKRDAHRAAPLNAGGDPVAARKGGGDPTASQVAVRREDVARLSSVLDRLPGSQRRVLVMRMRDELTFDEIGTRIGKSAEAARKTYHRSLDKLIDLLPRDLVHDGES